MPVMRTAGARMRAGGALLDLHVINAPREPCTIALGVDLFGLVLVQGSVPCRVLEVPSPSLVVTTVAINMARTGDDFSMILEHFVTKTFTLATCPALPCPTLPCPALPCPALPCPAMP
jgi:hypothetical protein